METQEIYNILQLAFAVIGGIFVYFQWKKNITLKRAEFIQQMTEKLRTDEKMSRTMYLLDYDYEWYNEDFHANSKIECDVDRLLSYLNYICYMKFADVISEKEFEALKYYVHRSLISCSSKRYLWNIYHFAKSNNSPCAFCYLIDYGIDNGVLPIDFKTNKTLYYKVLNF